MVSLASLRAARTRPGPRAPAPPAWLVGAGFAPTGEYLLTLTNQTNAAYDTFTLYRHSGDLDYQPVSVPSGSAFVSGDLSAVGQGEALGSAPTWSPSTTPRCNCLSSSKPTIFM